MLQIYESLFVIHSRQYSNYSTEQKEWLKAHLKQKKRLCTKSNTYTRPITQHIITSWHQAAQTTLSYPYYKELSNLKLCLSREISAFYIKILYSCLLALVLCVSTIFVVDY